MKNIVDCARVQIGRRRNALRVNKLEFVCEGFRNSPSYPIGTRAAQLNQILAVRAAPPAAAPLRRSTRRNSVAFMRAVMDKTIDKRTIGIGHEADRGIADDPLTSGIARGCRFDRRG